MAGAKATEDYNEAGNTDSGRRTVELCGWPTPKTPTGGGQTQRMTPGGGLRKLEDVALLAAWPTPNAMEGGQTSRGGKRKGEPLMGGLVGWATPRATDAKCGTEYTPNCEGKDLAKDASLCAWATPRAEDAESAGMRHSRGVADTLTAQAGQDAMCCHAETGKRGVLRPGHSRWLMGFPAA
jgi:hypothetical protein